MNEIIDVVHRDILDIKTVEEFKLKADRPCIFGIFDVEL